METRKYEVNIIPFTSWKYSLASFSWVHEGFTEVHCAIDTLKKPVERIVGPSDVVIDSLSLNSGVGCFFLQSWSKRWTDPAEMEADSEMGPT